MHSNIYLCVNMLTWKAFKINYNIILKHLHLENMDLLCGLCTNLLFNENLVKCKS